MSCNAILKKLYEPKMDVILTFASKYQRKSRQQNICFLSYFADEDVYRRFEKHNYVLSFIHCHGRWVYIVFSLLIARLVRPAIILPAEVSWKRNKMKDFYQTSDYVISHCGVVVRCSCVESKVPGSSPTELFLFLLSFFSVSLCCCFL